MWKRDEAVKPTSQPTPAAPVASNAQPSAPVGQQAEPRRIERDLVNIGKSVVIKGELSGSEDLTIEGHVEGKIELKDHLLTIGPNGRIKAQVFAKTVIVLGEVNGNVSASEKVEIRDGGSVDGDIVSPRVAIAEGAHFRGSVDMQKKGVHRYLGLGEQLVGEVDADGDADAGSGRRAGRAARRALSGGSPPIQNGQWPSRISFPAAARTSLISTRAPPRRPCIPPRCWRSSSPASAGASSPVLLDLGTVTGSNVTFFGERLGCKIIVEDLSKDIDRAVNEKTLAELPAHFAKRFTQEDASVDGVLCWDLFDYLDKHAAVGARQPDRAAAEA